MKIQLILPGLAMGGTEKMVYHLARGLQAHGHTVRVAVLKGDGPYAARLAALQIPVQPLHTPDTFWSGVADLPRLHKALRKEIETSRPDIIHSFLTRANVMTRWAAPDRSNVICSLRVMEQQKHFHRWGERLFSKPPRFFTVNSQALKAFAVRTLRLDASHVVVIYNGVDPSRDVPDEELTSLKSLHGIGSETILLAAGRLHAQKGFDLLLEVYLKIKSRHPDTLLLVAGEGPEQERLQILARQKGLSSSIRWLGVVKELAPYFRLARLFVLSSRWEGTPNVVLESMAAGCPVVTTDVGGVREILSAPAEGWVVPSHNIGALEQAIEEGLSFPDQARERARRAQERARHFSLQAMVEAHEALYNRVVKSTP